MRNLASPRARARAGDPMRDHDALPPALRQWAAQAALPWSARSLRRAWTRALARTGCPDAALHRLAAAETATLARETARVWGPGYPRAD
ncbi:DUF6525 family protein [Xinfangfangia pollutisoli]|uniref:DUF6525 family protein n=1 Tax=Xinfangfangia pollutisoli TaxID=2865960 RepID=UPI001CD7BFCC|nr:DUF6525 family protein [Xinfangfangia pollutisoli]